MKKYIFFPQIYSSSTLSTNHREQIFFKNNYCLVHHLEGAIYSEWGHTSPTEGGLFRGMIPPILHRRDGSSTVCILLGFIVCICKHFSPDIKTMFVLVNTYVKHSVLLPQYLTKYIIFISIQRNTDFPNL